MPLAEFTPDHKVESPYDYPKLSLDYGERARIILIEKQPTFEYIHTMRAPRIDESGKVVTEVRQKFGKPSEEVVYDFVGRHICIGDVNTIANKGVDVKNCPVCAASKETSAVKPPERRFAIHVIRYTLKPGGNSFEVATPLQVQCVGWAFGDKVFNQITDFNTEWGDLRKHDLKLGPCESKQFQKFEINVAGDAMWLKNDEWKELVSETYKNGKAPDISILIARRLSRELIEEDLDKVMGLHNRAFKGAAAAQGDTATETAAALDVDDVLGGSESAPETPEAVADTTDADEAPAPAAKPSEAKKEESVDFDSLLDAL